MVALTRTCLATVLLLSCTPRTAPIPKIEANVSESSALTSGAGPSAIVISSKQGKPNAVFISFDAAALAQVQTVNSAVLNFSVGAVAGGYPLMVHATIGPPADLAAAAWPLTDGAAVAIAQGQSVSLDLLALSRKHAGDTLTIALVGPEGVGDTNTAGSSTVTLGDGNAGATLSSFNLTVDTTACPTGCLGAAQSCSANTTQTACNARANMGCSWALNGGCGGAHVACSSFSAGSPSCSAGHGCTPTAARCDQSYPVTCGSYGNGTCQANNCTYTPASCNTRGGACSFGTFAACDGAGCVWSDTSYCSGGSCQVSGATPPCAQPTPANCTGSASCSNTNIGCTSYAYDKCPTQDCGSSCSGAVACGGSYPNCECGRNDCKGNYCPGTFVCERAPVRDEVECRKVGCTPLNACENDQLRANSIDEARRFCAQRQGCDGDAKLTGPGCSCNGTPTDVDITKCQEMKCNWIGYEYTCTPKQPLEYLGCGSKGATAPCDYTGAGDCLPPEFGCEPARECVKDGCPKVPSCTQPSCDPFRSCTVDECMRGVAGCTGSCFGSPPCQRAGDPDYGCRMAYANCSYSYGCSGGGCNAYGSDRQACESASNNNACVWNTRGTCSPYVGCAVGACPSKYCVGVNAGCANTPGVNYDCASNYTNTGVCNQPYCTSVAAQCATLNGGLDCSTLGSASCQAEQSAGHGCVWTTSPSCVGAGFSCASITNPTDCNPSNAPGCNWAPACPTNQKPVLRTMRLPPVATAGVPFDVGVTFADPDGHAPKTRTLIATLSKGSDVIATAYVRPEGIANDFAAGVVFSAPLTVGSAMQGLTLCFDAKDAPGAAADALCANDLEVGAAPASEQTATEAVGAAAPTPTPADGVDAPRSGNPTVQTSRFSGGALTCSSGGADAWLVALAFFSVVRRCRLRSRQTTAPPE